VRLLAIHNLPTQFLVHQDERAIDLLDGVNAGGTNGRLEFAKQEGVSGGHSGRRIISLQKQGQID
jgi:hypothetical protein